MDKENLNKPVIKPELSYTQCEPFNFFEKLSPYPFVKDENMSHIYAKVINGERVRAEEDMNTNENMNTNEDRYCVHISLMNNFMVEIDYEYFTSNNQTVLQKNYKPYYYEFYAEISVEEYQRLIEATKYEWFNAQLIHEEDIDINKYLLKGTVEFSASPFIERGMGLKYNTYEVDASILKKLEDSVYTFSDAITIGTKRYDILSNVLNIAFGHYKKIKARIYDVGQANCIYLPSKIKKHRVLFDVGIPKVPKKSSIDRKKYRVKKSISSIMKFVPGLVILSHWDLDHIKGAFLLRDTAFSIYWIAPSLTCGKTRITQSAKRVARYLDFNDKLLHISNKCDGHLIWKNHRARLWKGNSKVNNKDKSLSKKNNTGLILQLAGRDGTTILSGDCEYLCWPDDLHLKHNKYLIVPHHGSKLKNYCKLTENIFDYAHAYISVGEDGKVIYKWNHPSDEHINRLEACGYNVVSTLTKGNQEFFV